LRYIPIYKVIYLVYKKHKLGERDILKKSISSRNMFLILLGVGIVSVALFFSMADAEKSGILNSSEISHVVKAYSTQMIVQIDKKDSFDQEQSEEQEQLREKKQVEELNPKQEEMKEVKKEESLNTRTAYLTFDDGPTHNNTTAILDILLKERIKATFFVIGIMAEKNPDILKRQKLEGHVIGNHTYSHNYNYIYSNTDNYLEDLKKGDQVLVSILGEYNRKLTRFPAGSFGKHAYIRAIEDAGYKYVDWNSLNGDSEGKPRSAEELINRVKETSLGKDKLIVLMHDSPGKENTVQALPMIIKYLREQGYEFGVLQ
jgi:peptidoglycan/xylan/chitin deacetylase (PgdA/CDA1 family)